MEEHVKTIPNNRGVFLLNFEILYLQSLADQNHLIENEHISRFRPIPFIIISQFYHPVNLQSSIVANP